MALDRTSGFDMLVQISENELNNQVATAFLAGALFPSTMAAPVNAGGVVGTANLNFTTPTVDLDRPRPSMGLTVPFVNSQLQITAPVPTTIAPLGGIITIVDQIEMITQGTNQIATMDFNNGAPTVTVVFDAPSQTVLAPFLAAAGRASSALR
jgi:xanthosine utilization system XapX-like protein